MQVNIKKVKKQFEKTMDKYNSNAIVQIHMAEKLVDAVSKYGKNFNRILELGSGTGVLTNAAAKNFVFQKYYANDLIDKSQKYLDKILTNYQFICGNAQKIKPSCKMDLILSNAMFQWFNNIDAAHFAGMLEHDGLLAFSTFLPDNFVEIRDITGLSLRYKSVDEIKNILSEYFEILYIEEYKEILKFTSVLELLAHMKNTGVNSLTSNKWTFNAVKEFCERYKEKYPDIHLTYAPVIVVAKKYAVK